MRLMPGRLGRHTGRSVTYLGGALGSVNIGMADPFTHLVFAAAEFSGGGLPAFDVPTINGVAMTQAVQENSGAGGDGQRTGIWYGPIPMGGTITVNHTNPGGSVRAFYRLSGVRSMTPTVVGGANAALTRNVGAFVVGCFVHNFATISAVNEMTFDTTNVNNLVAHDPSMSANTVTYTVTGASQILQTKAAFDFDFV